MRSPTLKNFPEAFRGLKSDYAGSTPSRFRRNRPGIFGSGDSHYANEWNFIRMREYVRDMDRNDAIVGQLVDRAVANQVQNGYLLKPQTGDKKLDQDLADRFNGWGNDPDECDLAGELPFAEMQRLTARTEYIDGDIFALPIDNGRLQIIEADRCRTPANTRRNVVHGVLLDDDRKHLEYWFAKDNLNPYERIYRVTDMDRIPTRDADGNRQVFHIYKPSRVSQTRGVTAFHAIFDIAGMVEDVNFATLIKQQMAACVVFFLERTELYGADARTGERRTDQLDDSTTATTEGISPGQFVKGAKGERLTIPAGNLPSAEFLPHMRFLLQVIGCNLGLPLVLVLLDGKESNFSGARVALDQARMGFRSEQIRRGQRFHTPVYIWKVRQFLAEDPALRSAAAKSGIKIFRHIWKPPSWPYLQPLHDAQADKIRVENLLASNTQIAAEDGRDFSDILAESIADSGNAIEAAIAKAKAIESRFPGVKIHWRDVLNRALPQGARQTDDITDDTAVEPEPQSGKKKPKDEEQ